ncbi:MULTISPECIES: aldolase/citrate lyase family protein [unclassified Beijerinckia]|uniref:HpcH/HpaI aldolase family protein n=1 Tax=unclassified Beijerinckia TaxID=2638183 RepID=UPI0008979436|nr:MULTISPECIES: aldolase/citrate lyase family protein [unclassified Beijerinckia]MDH7799003.1 2-keto-3-deoxy-L-rhamnonate aldolase RhmA [Beijerinckia sp. GAS462]SED84663.1 2-keto-3-deoxy-L-rhamnonate aldolase RhmA [Beijerinckia sp. 28-YEA-48]
MSSIRKNLLLDRLRANELTLMLAIRTSRTPDIIRIAHATGHHAVMLDLEHSTITLDTTAQLCGTANDLGLVPLVRIPEREYGAIGRLLDAGAGGIVAPRVETPVEAQTIARACRFPPRGQRSQLAMVPQFGLRPTPASLLNPKLDDATVVQILIETPKGIANADAIAAIDGVDMLVIGANDLTAELGCPGQFGDPRVRDAIAVAAKACRRHDKLLMLGGISDLSLVATLMPLGIAPMQLTGTDTEILFGAIEARARKFTEWHAAQAS